MMSCCAGVPPICVPNICSVDRAASQGTASLLHVLFVPALVGAHVLGEGRQRPSSDQAYAGTQAICQQLLCFMLFAGPRKHLTAKALCSVQQANCAS